MKSISFTSLILFLLLSLASLFSCANSNKPTQNTSVEISEPITITTEDYELIIPPSQEALLILFPCFPCDANNTKMEFNIVDIAIENNIGVLLMNFNQHLWLSDIEKKQLEELILDVTTRNKIKTDNTYIGGFSSGGNVSLLMSNYLKEKKSSIQPKGVFIADSPIDLLALYENAERTIKKQFSDVAIQEANWIISKFDAEIGSGDTAIINYELNSPFLSETRATKNLSHLKDVGIRLYSEPDTTWWKTNRLAEYENMNAYFIEQLSFELVKLYGKDDVQYIQTENRGYRANGDRHPHSWAIIDEVELVKWILEE